MESDLNSDFEQIVALGNIEGEAKCKIELIKFIKKLSMTHNTPEATAVFLAMIEFINLPT